MSAGAFELTRYEADSGLIHPIKVQEETLTANFGGANTPPAGETDTDISAKVSKGNREYGLRPRLITVRFSAAPPTGYKAEQLYRIPILTPARWAAVNKGTTGTYLGTAAVVVSKSGEDTN